jgi:hypothetical protein
MNENLKLLKTEYAGNEQDLNQIIEWEEKLRALEGYEAFREFDATQEIARELQARIDEITYKIGNERQYLNPDGVLLFLKREVYREVLALFGDPAAEDQERRNIQSLIDEEVEALEGS